MKAAHVASFICGAAAMLAVSTVTQSFAQKPNHVYELRIYHVNPGKLDAVSDRFRDGTERVFQRVGINSLGYWTPQDKTQNLFIYLVQHDSKEAADKNWAAFQADPEWKKVKAESEVNGVLVNRVENYFMNPTTYSRLK